MFSSLQPSISNTMDTSTVDELEQRTIAILKNPFYQQSDLYYGVPMTIPVSRALRRPFVQPSATSSPPEPSTQLQYQICNADDKVGFY